MKKKNYRHKSYLVLVNNTYVFFVKKVENISCEYNRLNG